MVVTLGRQQYNVGEKPTVILQGHQKNSENKNNVHLLSSNMVVIIYCYICCEDKATTWYLNGFPEGSNLGSKVYWGKTHRYTVHFDLY